MNEEHIDLLDKQIHDARMLMVLAFDGIESGLNRAYEIDRSDDPADQQTAAVFALHKLNDEIEALYRMRHGLSREAAA